MHILKPSPRMSRVALVVALLVTTYLATTPLDYPLISDINDKLQHICAFFMLALLADHAFPREAWNWRKALPLLVYGLALEIVQYTVPGRHFSLWDLGADGIGLLFYSLFPLLTRRPSIRHDTGS